MTIEQVIKKAIEEGEFPEKKWDTHARMFLNPLFWQSLSKAMKWKICIYGCFPGGHDYCGGYHKEEWLYHWHRFIDHLAEGKKAEGFFEKLT